MKDHNGIHQSLWVAHTEMSQGALLAGHTEAEVCVIGAGIAGLTTAYLLAKEGRHVILVDADKPGTGQTARTSAHLAWEIDDRLYEVERIHGTEAARLAIDAHASAIDRIESICLEEGIECDFRRIDGYLFAANAKDEKELERELEAAQRIGRSDVERLGKVPGTEFGSCLRFPNQARFQPLAYIAGLRKAFERAGGQFFSGARVIDVGEGQPSQIKLENGSTIVADYVVVATNSPITNRVVMHTKMHAYLTHVIAIELGTAAMPDALLWDTLDPYHYVRLSKIEGERDLLIVGGEDHKTGQAPEHDPYQALEQWTREKFPGTGEVRYRWSGQVMETLDGLAFIGENPLSLGNIYIACGDSGMGLTHGTIAGILLTDLISGRRNSWRPIFDPARKPAKALGEYVVENADMALQYRDYLTPGEVSSEAEIAPGEGAVVRHGLHKVAVYRSHDGKVHSCSAVCPHLGGIVRWNKDEKTWDCPLHGSRFGARGECIQGPAYRGLSSLDGEEANKEEGSRKVAS